MPDVKMTHLDFSAFQWCQNAKNSRQNDTAARKIAHCQTSFCHIHRHKAVSHDRQKLADSVRSKLNECVGWLTKSSLDWS